ncbi:MAG: iron-sulfur cluster assembly accessory protein [Lysobacterales bacterium]|nr:MAG: iron-sulfur cluster assembly accessory protein [Xanthomonadales bacterium]
MAVMLTDTAAERVKRYLTERGAGAGLRIGIKTTGCSGFAYVVDIADEIATDDQVFESHGVKVIVGTDNLSFLDGTTIDFSREGLNEGFSYDNPNVKSLCGCGESFGV